MSDVPFEFFEAGEQIPRISKLDARAFGKDFEARARPVIITDMTCDWPCVERWSTSYIREVAGHREVNLSLAKNGIHFDDAEGPRMSTLANYMTQIEQNNLADGLLYAGNVSVRDSVPEIWPDVVFPTYMSKDDRIPPSLWIGPGGNIVPIHYDATNNLFAQIRGQKTVLLFAPEERKNLYPLPIRDRHFYFSRTNVTKPDLARFPKMKRARCSVVELKAGEILFIPRFWWHSMFGQEFNISLSFWWEPKDKLRWQYPLQEAGFRYRNFRRSRRNFVKALTGPFARR